MIGLCLSAPWLELPASVVPDAVCLQIDKLVYLILIVTTALVELQSFLSLEILVDTRETNIDIGWIEWIIVVKLIIEVAVVLFSVFLSYSLLHQSFAFELLQSIISKVEVERQQGVAETIVLNPLLVEGLPLVHALIQFTVGV